MLYAPAYNSHQSLILLSRNSEPKCCHFTKHFHHKNARHVRANKETNWPNSAAAHEQLHIFMEWLIILALLLLNHHNYTTLEKHWITSITAICSVVHFLLQKQDFDSIYGGSDNEGKFIVTLVTIYGSDVH